jgi:hypothetical protein
MHRIQLPSYYFLQVWRNFANQKIECPVRGSREGDTFRADIERKDLPIRVSFHTLRKQSRKYLWGI